MRLFTRYWKRSKPYGSCKYGAQYLAYNILTGRDGMKKLARMRAIGIMTRAVLL